MNRETITLKLPVSGFDIVLNKYLIGRERRALANVYLDNGLKVNETGKIDAINSKMTDAAQDLAWKITVVSVNGKNDVIEEILNLHQDDYQFVTDEVNKITANKALEQKKTI